MCLLPRECERPANVLLPHFPHVAPADHDSSRFGVEEAKDKGLVNRVVPDDKVEEESLAAARLIADGAPLVARRHKKFARRLASPRPPTGRERDEAYACFDTEDFKTGVKAFLAKQKPEFKGK